MNAETLSKLVEMADAHQKADQYIAGSYEQRTGRKWVGGCAIGCTIHDAKKIGIVPKNVAAGDHAALARANGVPELVWRLTDAIFEGLPQEERAAWTPRLLRAIRPDADYSTLPAHMSAALMLDEQIGLAVVATREDVREAAKVIGALYLRRARGDEPSAAEWDAASRQADAAYQQADAARQQADAAYQQADAARQQADAAYQQAARQQADAAYQQADAASRQAYAAYRQADAASQQAYAASQQAYAAYRQADAASRQAYAAYRQADAASQQAYAAYRQADAASQQAYAASQQAYAAYRQADAAYRQADAASQQAYAAYRQAYAAYRQADAALYSFWRRCADILCGLLQEHEMAVRA